MSSINMGQPGYGAAQRVQELKELLQQKKEQERLSAQEARAIEDELNRAQSSTAFGFDPIPGDYQVSSSLRSQLKEHERSRNNTVPRSAAAVHGLKAEHTQQLLQDQTRPMKRSKTTHSTGSFTQQPMMRSSSSASAGRAGRLNPSRASAAGLVPPPYPSVARVNLPPTGSDMIDVFLNKTQFQQPINATMYSDYDDSVFSKPQAPALLAGGYKEMDVSDWLQGRDSDFQTSPIGIPSSGLSSGLLSPNDAIQFPGNSGIPSACGSMTSGPTLETPMTRSNSALNDNSSFLGQFSEMIRIESQNSASGHAHPDSFRNSQQMTNHALNGKRSGTDPNFLEMGANLTESYAYAYPASAPTDSLLSQHQHGMERSVSQSSTRSSSSSADIPVDIDSSSPFFVSMERSISKDSIKSNTSLSHRAKEALARQNVNAAKARHLQPKPIADLVKKESAPEPASSKSKDGKAVIAKAKYERPKHPKVMCPQCNENPEGFRGEHELRRHTEAKHKHTVKKWICRDPSTVGISHSETATKPLTECKHCSQGKLYGAYYNAAAHLRRTHFRVKVARKNVSGSKNGSKGSGTAVKVEEKRGGKGGGDWPPMTELKLWMLEVTVPMDQDNALTTDAMNSVAGVDPDDDGELFDNQYGMAFTGVGSSFPADHLHGLDHSLQGMQGDLASQTPDLFRLDTSMYSSSAAVHSLPISSSEFEYSTTSSDQHHQHNMASSIMSLDSHGYTSPVSSTATITQSGPYGDHHMLPPPTAHAPRDDLPDMSFDMTFSAVGY